MSVIENSLNLVNENNNVNNWEYLHHVNLSNELWCIISVNYNAKYIFLF